MYGKTPLNVFVSIGSVRSHDQAVTVSAIESALKEAGFTPRPLAEPEWSNVEPLEAVKRAMGDCSGALIIASSRSMIEVGSEDTSTGPRSLAGKRLPTVWNHIEAAVAWALGLPLLVIGETGLKTEGFLEDDRGWPIVRCPFSNVVSESVKAQLSRAIKAWKPAVLQYDSSR